MKRNYTLLVLVLVLVLFLFSSVSILAQTPEKMSYQLVLRDASNTLLTNQQVGIQISILQTTNTGSAVYTETQTATTNINGLLSLEIGTGTSSDNFSAIDWSAGPYFIKTATDASGGNNYTIIGTSQLMSVPFALYAKTSGNDALKGNYNIAVGSSSLAVNTTGQHNVAIGYVALTKNTGGFSNVALGSMALTSNIGGHSNTALGYQALYHNTGSQNVAIGAGAGLSNTNGSGNVAIGPNAQNLNTTGPYNIAIGAAASEQNVSSQGNVVIGHQAMRYAKTAGNTALGYRAGFKITSGANNTFLGYLADASSADVNYSMAIGNGAIVNASNKVQIGNGVITAVQLGIGANVTLETGLVKLTGGTPGVGKVLTSDADGLASWEEAPGGQASGTTTGDMQYWNGTAWVVVAATPNEGATLQMISGVPTWVGGAPLGPAAAIGDLRDGGIVFWVDGNGSGKVCALEDEPTALNWDDAMSLFNSYTNSDTGTGVYNDWYLPSKDELQLMYANLQRFGCSTNTPSATDSDLCATRKGNFLTTWYWSSTELTSNQAWYLNFNVGNQSGNGKNGTYNVRAVRAF
jgi:hypothetical protein